MKTKAILLAVMTLGVAFQSTACVARWLGDLLGDAIWLRAID